MDASNSPSTKPLFRATQVVWYLVGLLEILLAGRFLLKLFSANTGAGFTGLIYYITGPLTYPFSTVFSTSQVELNVFEWTTLLAMAVYWLIGWGIIKLFLVSKTVSTSEAAAKLV